MPPDPRLPTSEERALLRASLQRPLPEIPPVYFYDDHGSALFERITELPVYYPTRAELRILERHAGEIMARARPRRIVELGSGAGRKIRLLLDAWGEAGAGGTCTMLDVNQRFLDASAEQLAAAYPGVAFRGVLGDFTRDLAALGPGGDRLVVFFGGTVGNLHPDERAPFFRALAAQMKGADEILLGVDLVKDPARLSAAYNDPEGVTAEFNLNALRVLNQRFGADFDLSAFGHRAFWDPERAWIEMRVRAERPTRATFPALDLTLSFAAGDEIRTELSCKFTRASLAASIAPAGLGIARWYTDPEELFALAVLERTAA